MTTNAGPKLFTKRLNTYPDNKGWRRGVLYEIHDDAEGRYIIDSLGRVDRESEYKTPFKNGGCWQLFWLFPDGTELEALE